MTFSRLAARRNGMKVRPIFQLPRRGPLFRAQSRTKHSIFQRLAESDPGNAEWQRDLAQSHCWLGNVEQAQGNLATAGVRYRAYRDGMQRLAESDPGNAAWQRD